MNSKLIVKTFLFLMVSNLAIGQVIGVNKIDDKKVIPWITMSEKEYQHVYHFGNSEMESDFILINANNNYFGQIKSGSFSDDGKAWIWTYKNLTNIRIKGNKFYSDQTNGEFVIYKHSQDKIKGLKIYNSWSGTTGIDQYEIGTKSYRVDNYFNGKYPEASKKVLTKSELLRIRKSNLKIMRNEIFARYGYKFKLGSDLHNYFKIQDWYSRQHDNVDNFLTELEKENIELIKQVEGIL